MLLIDLSVMLPAVRQAAALTRRVQRTIGDGLMKDGEPVTIADYGAQAILCRALAALFPEDAVMAEESGEQFLSLVSADDRALTARLVAEITGEPASPDDLARWMNHGRGLQAERTWLIDPVDGTKGFIAGRRYSIALGVLAGGLAVAGILACPGYPAGRAHGLLIFGQRGAAHMEALDGGRRYRIAVRPAPRGLVGVRAVESSENAHADHDGFLALFGKAGLKAPKLERIDSQDKYAMVACGDADLYVRLPKDERPHKVWDHAAGAAIVQAAGGVVTDVDGTLLDFSLGRTLANNRGMVVSSGGELHERVLEALAPQFPPRPAQ